MAGVIEIRDTRQESPDGPPILSVTLADVLDCIASEGRRLAWTIPNLEAVGELSDDRKVLDVEDQIAGSPHGLSVPLGELLVLARELDQVAYALIVGVRDSIIAPPLSREIDYCAGSDLVLEMIDSSLWSVYARDDRVLRPLRERFRDINLLTAPKRPA